MYRGALVSTTDGSQHLLSQPYEICLQVGQQGWRLEISRDRLVTVQQVLRIFLEHYINGVEQALKITVLVKGRADIGHDAVPHEQHLLIGQIDEHAVLSLTTLNRDHFYASAADRQVSALVDPNVRLVAVHIVIAEVLTEKWLAEDSGTVELARYSFLIIAPAVV